MKAAYNISGKVEDPSIIDSYLKAIADDKSPQEAYYNAVKTSVVNRYPQAGTHEGVPTTIISQGEKPVITGINFAKDSKIYPHARVTKQKSELSEVTKGLGLGD